MDKNVIYTHDEADQIVRAFDNFLVKKEVYIPEADDWDDPRPKDMYGLFGSDYSELLDFVENKLKDIIRIIQTGDYLVVPDKFSGNY